MEEQNLKYLSVTRNWGGMEVRREFDNKIDRWISQFDESERDIILELLRHYKYYTSRKLKDRVISLYKNFIDEYHENSDDITFIPVYKEYGVGFSDEFFNKFWITNDLKESAEKNIFKLLEQGSSFKKIAILDDYSGSGNTIKRTIKNCIKTNPNCKSTIFYILTVQMSKIAYGKIQNYALEQGVDVRILSLEIEDRVFEQDYIFPRNIVNKMQDDYCKICFNHNVKENNYLGFEKTQALLSFEYNTPNNTLGLFWHEGDEFFAIFKRHKKRTTILSQMQNDAKLRCKERSKNIIKNHDEDEKYIFLMIYLINMNLKFNYTDACSKFGMSEEQMDEAIGYLLSNKYISFADGNIKPTNKLKQMVVISKIKEVKEENIKEKIKEEVTEFIPNQSYIPRKFDKLFSGY